MIDPTRWLIISGIATEWHGWTMSRSPGAKRAPDRETNKKEKKMKKKKKKREWRKEKKKRKKRREEKTKLFKYPAGAPARYIPMSLSRSVGTILSWLTARDCNNITPPLTILDKVVKLMKGAYDHRFDLVDPPGSRSSRLPSPFDTTLHNDFLQGVSTSSCNVSKIFHHLDLDMR